ncbi:hypothetical protein MINTM008_46780 [Mycobacterium intracellulare]|nr:hypothetical protein MINTM002_44080 [Mycobacterium intracellulare]BCP17425.1 hypothetical protein MINTM021_43340 [Mycobacterium paraintracellulare]BCO59254.1 hypothetical protein MINTM005_44980 [Mycobacterium intracellulare]BCO64515.1 hypothetical protein MINTM006_44650 [Mycobacterium intracellulare]BCO69826.1 hypothetical protein MINTM007_44370 [Mycobacterium intracellulare]
MGDVVDAHVGETAGGEQVDGHVGDMGRRGRAAPAHPRLRHLRTPPFHFGTRCHILAASVTQTPSLSRPDERQGPVDHETETDTQLVTETLVEEVSIDGMCGVY